MLGAMAEGQGDGVTVGVLRERAPGERRVALTPDAIQRLAPTGAQIVVERGAGDEAGYLDAAYEQAGARLADAAGVLAAADVLVRVGRPSDDEVDALREGTTVIGLLAPLQHPALAGRLAAAGVTALAMELVPRITRAQSMDVLSSQATIAGYKAVLLAATSCPEIFPMLMTAAGTIRPPGARHRRRRRRPAGDRHGPRLGAVVRPTTCGPRSRSRSRASAPSSSSCRAAGRAAPRPRAATPRSDGRGAPPRSAS